MTALWTHEPMVSAAPIELLEHIEHNQEGQLYEAAVFKLENDKYLFISFSKDGNEEQTGVTDYEEFDKLEEAVKLFKEMTE